MFAFNAVRFAQHGDLLLVFLQRRQLRAIIDTPLEGVSSYQLYNCL